MRPISSTRSSDEPEPGVAAPTVGRNLDRMGFNPQRKMAKTPADYAMVIGAIVVCVLLLAWAFLG